MVVAALVVAGLALLVSLLAALAVAELHSITIGGDAREPRGTAGGLDRMPLDLEGASVNSPSQSGLPQAFHRGTHFMLFLTPRCWSCRQIARDVVWRPLGDELKIVVALSSGQSHESALRELGLANQVAWFDADHQLMTALGINVTPAVVVVQDDAFVYAEAISNFEMLSEFLSERHEVVGQ